MPVRVSMQTSPAMKNGALSMGGAGIAPAPFFEELAVAEPEPGWASPVLVPSPAFCDPSPFRPGPVPAPAVMN